jgi:Concanavalin A-like lectin/glucanases superfamily
MTALVLHWPLDAVSAQSRALDASPNKLNGDVKGDPANVADPRVGSCLEFDGADDVIIIGDVPQLRLGTYTIEAWVQPGFGPRPAPVGLVCRASPNHRVLLNADGSIEHRFTTSTVPDAGHKTGPGSVPGGTWRHVAVTNDGRTAKIFVDGVEANSYAFTGDRVPDQAVLLVGSTGPAAGFYPGRMAHLRIYDGALLPLEIQRDIADDEAALESFIRTHPIDFAFVNADLQPVLFIDENPAGQSMTLELTNTSRRDVEATPLGTSAFHFALRFRRGTLPSGLRPKLVASAEWAMTSEADGTALYFQWQPGKPIAPGTSVTVRVDGMTADGADGTRGTRVELEYQNLRYSGDPTELSGTRMQFLDVVNHRGRRDIPLDLRLVDGDRVLCDGQTASKRLRLHLTNVLRDGPGIAFRAGASAIVVSFDVQAQGENRPWALTTYGQADSVDLGVPPGWRVTRNLLGQRVEWTLTPDTDTVLKADTFLELTLDNVIGLASVGHAPIAVDYRDIPGYANGTLTVPVERTPLLYTSTRVGVGTTEPLAGLHVFSPHEDPNGVSGIVVGRWSPGNLRLGQDLKYSWIQSHGNLPLALNPIGNAVGIGVSDPRGKLHVSHTIQDASGNAVIIGPVDRANLRLGHHRDYTWIQGHGGRPLALNPQSGSVGIGTTAPPNEVKVAVTATGSHLQLRREAAAGPGGKILYLELFQDTTPGDGVTYPSVRFHHGWKFWHRIEGRPEGIQFKDGNLDYDGMIDIYARIAVVAGLRIGDVTIGEHELRILQKLAAGQLQFDLYSVHQDEYAYAADYAPFDNDRRRIFTWRPKGRVSQGRWRIDYPGW